MLDQEYPSKCMQIAYILYTGNFSHRIMATENATENMNEDRKQLCRAILAADAIVDGKMTKGQMQNTARLIVKYLEATEAYWGEE